MANEVVAGKSEKLKKTLKLYDPTQHEFDGTVKDQFHEYYIDYASYVSLDRAIPAIEDGLKPVQRRVLHSIREMDDGRFNKVANIVGNTMKYHPHGDTSIYGALVNLAQKGHEALSKNGYLLDKQGNFGNPITGDNAAAGRYIEARLSKFAKDVVFNPKITEWLDSYDGRNQEPLRLPVKFPLLLLNGVEGIAVGLSTKILSHNFNEICNACIAHLKEESFQLLPDFQNGGEIDCSTYEDGIRGGKIKVRAKIETINKSTLQITELPGESTSEILVESIVSATKNGKIKIKKIENNTTKKVDIVIYLHSGVDVEATKQALFAWTKCEQSLSPITCVIRNSKPVFLRISEILKESVSQTKKLLNQELEIRKKEILEKMLLISLERIFIENEIYNKIKAAENKKEMLTIIESQMAPHLTDIYRPLLEEDYLRLSELPIRKIARFDIKKSEEILKTCLEEFNQVKHNIQNIVAYTIAHYVRLKKEYGVSMLRRSEVTAFDKLHKATVAANDAKLYCEIKGGYFGYGSALKKELFISECSTVDSIICFFKNGTMKVLRNDEKVFAGKGLHSVAVWKKGDTETIYNMIYQDGTSETSMIKRFCVDAITHDKEYDLTKGTTGSKLTFFQTQNNADSPLTIKVVHHEKKGLRKKEFEFDFNDLIVKGRSASGNILTRHAIKKITKLN